MERAEELVDLTLRTLTGDITPVMAKFDCKMIEVCPTSQQPMRDFTDRLMALEAHSELSSLSLLPSHSGGDPSVSELSLVSLDSAPFLTFVCTAEGRCGTASSGDDLRPGELFAPGDSLDLEKHGERVHKKLFDTISSV